MPNQLSFCDRIRPAVEGPGISRVLASVVAVVFLTATAAACDAPVYRYAMYNWKTTPYQVFYFHDSAEKDGGTKKTDSEAVNRLLRELSTSEEPVNVNLVEVDTRDGESVARLPEQVRAAWKRRRAKSDTGQTGGIHVVFSPWGRELFAGRLDADTVRAMTESPARKRLGELLAQGKLVAVCISGKQEEDNQRVEAAVKVLADLAEADVDNPKFEVASLNVSPSDPKESWFVKILMSAEADLNEYAGQPMLFMSYGRGRSMLPYIGPGITVENLQGCVTFLTGDCSCEVKADNPGIDLLMRSNWEAAADAMAADDDKAPARDGQLTYREFDPGELANNSHSRSRKAGLENGGFQANRKSTRESESVENVEAAEAGTRDSAAGESFATRQTWLLGGGLAIIVVVVLIGGLFLMRRN